MRLLVNSNQILIIKKLARVILQVSKVSRNLASAIILKMNSDLSRKTNTVRTLKKRIESLSRTKQRKISFNLS